MSSDLSSETKTECGAELCEICGSSIMTAMQIAHLNDHFNDANKPEITTDSSGIRRYDLHPQDYSAYTPFGQCLALAKYLNSDFPRENGKLLVDATYIVGLSHARSQFAHALKMPPAECVAAFDLQHDLVSKLITQLFREERYAIHSCRHFLKTIRATSAAASE